MTEPGSQGGDGIGSASRVYDAPAYPEPADQRVTQQQAQVGTMGALAVGAPSSAHDVAQMKEEERRYATYSRWNTSVSRE